MSKRLVFLFIIIFSFISLYACAKDEPVIVKKEAETVDPNEEPELVEQSNKEEIDEFIEFALPDEVVMINLEMVPILNEYLHAIEDREAAIGAMKMLKIDAVKRNLYLLEFSCKDNLCSYLLLDQSKENQAYLVADLAKSIQTKLSPDHSKILLHFNRETSLPIPISDLVVIDLDEWEPIKLTNQTNELMALDYNWPIITAEWLDSQTISAMIPAIMEPTSELILEWQDGGNSTTSLELSIDAKE